jgi:hypothetical protein
MSKPRNPGESAGQEAKDWPEKIRFDLELQDLEPLETIDASLPDLPPGVTDEERELLTVAKQAFHVRVRLMDGEVLEGQIFLVEPLEGNPEEPLVHWLNELKDGFFPLREAGGSIPMVHTRALRWIAAPCEAQDHKFLSAKRHVKLVLAHGEELEGTVGLDVETRGPRLSDLLNEFRPYLALQTQHELILVNRMSISRAYDLGPE